MKKVLFATGVAVLAFAMIAGATGYTFSNNLTIGSTGADVTALQNVLISSGFDIPAISSGAATTGYFGSQTKTALAKYQVAKGIVSPGTGFFGPLTMKVMNGGSTVASNNCLAGWTAATYAGTTYCVPPGQTLPTGSVVTPGTVAGITTPGIPGTLVYALQTTFNNSTLDKGKSVDVARYKLQASASDMQVSSISFDVDKRLWLYVGAITIKDDAGTVIASKSGLMVSDFSELTVGSSYRITVPVNYVVPKATSKYFTINLTALPATDRTSAETITIDRKSVV